MRILLRVAYDGTAYSGWQYQNNANTIEGELNLALSSLTGEEIAVIGASRTDAGVHSLGNVCVFDTETRIPPEKICYAVNNLLPQDIRVVESCKVEDDFHPRHRDSMKTYEYKIWNDRFPSPVYRLYSHFSYRKIDVSKMREAAALLVGEHDFAAFCAAGSQAETTVRTIYGIEILVDRYVDGQIVSPEEEVPENNLSEVKLEECSDTEKDEKERQKETDNIIENGKEERYVYGKMIRIRVTGSGFLYNMVRIIAGTLLDVGTGLMEVSDVEKCLETCKREDAGPTAPACGLTMIRYE